MSISTSTRDTLTQEHVNNWREHDKTILDCKCIESDCLRNRRKTKRRKAHSLANCPAVAHDQCGVGELEIIGLRLWKIEYKNRR